MQFLTVLNQVVLQGIKKSFEEAHLDTKNPLNFNCHTLKFHNCHRTSTQYWQNFIKNCYDYIFTDQ